MKSQLVSHSNEAWLHRLIAPFLRSGASHIDTPCRDEVIPHLYGTPQKESPERAVESLHGEADAGSGRTSSPPRSGRLGCVGVDGEQLGSSAGTDPVCGAAATSVGDR